LVVICCPIWANQMLWYGGAGKAKTLGIVLEVGWCAVGQHASWLGPDILVGLRCASAEGAFVLIEAGSRIVYALFGREQSVSERSWGVTPPEILNGKRLRASERN
jgi:hypothetical protein